jgi:hypothetical protein
MAVRAPIQPTYGRGQIVSAGAASANVAIDAQAKQVILTNQSVNPIYVRVGAGTQTATTADYPVPPNSQVVISKGDGDNNLAHIAPAGASTLHLMTGEGF